MEHTINGARRVCTDHVQRITAPDPPSDTVGTRFAGQLSFRGGFPTADTLQCLHDQLDFRRG
jgi:hypothetical protein